MSYILDALKKAETERERGVVPGLNSAQANHSTFIHYGSDQRPWWLPALAMIALLAVAIAIWAVRQPVAVTATAPLAPPAGVVGAAPAMPPEVPQPFAEAKAPAAPLHKSELPLAAPTSAAVAARPSPPDVAGSTVAHVQAKVAPSPAGAATAVTPPVAVPAEPPGKPVPNPLPIRTASGGAPMLADLPDTLRRQIPALNISGAIYSDSPAEWTLIINDQVMGKGSQVAPDVRLEEISATSAVFNFKGQRFRIEH